MRFLLILSLLCIGIFFRAVPTTAQDKNNYHSLNNIFKIVYETNPTLMAAREELKETLELYPQARAGWLPSLTGEVSIFSTRVKNSNFSGADGATTKDLTLNLDQPIWRGGRTFAETARAKDLIRAGQATLMQAEQDILLETATIYVNVVRDQELLGLRKKNEDILLQELRVAWERVHMGDITNTDFHQAKSRLSRAKSQRIQAETNLTISRAEFTKITGSSATHKLMPPYINLSLPETVDATLKLAEEKSPALIIATYDHKAAQHKADATFRELLPQISAFASFNRQEDPQPGIVDRSENETIGIRATLALYEGGATRSRQREANHAVKRRAYQIQETKRRIRQEIISNWRSYSNAKAQTANRKQEIEAAEAALQGIKFEASMGQRTMLDILNADEEVIEAKIALSQARRNEIAAQYALASSLGLLGQGL